MGHQQADKGHATGQHHRQRRQQRRQQQQALAQLINGNAGQPRFNLGYGLCLGQNEVKAISMGVLDRTLRTAEPSCPAEDQEFVLYHSDGIESMGFSNHWKLPHYVDFLSDLDRLRKAQETHARP